MSDTTTIRLPPKLRARIHALAKQSGRSAHSFILEAVERTGEVYRADDVHAWVERLARSQDAARPKPGRR